MAARELMSWVFPERYLSQSGINGENRETRHPVHVDHQGLSPPAV
jgi:hypothetical protein